MKKLKFVLLFLLSSASAYAQSEYVHITTPNTSLVLYAKAGETPQVLYYGARVAGVDDILNSGTGIWYDAMPAFGTSAFNEPAVQATHADGNMSLVLAVEQVAQQHNNGVTTTGVTLKDPAYPFYLKLCYKTYDDSDVIEAWTEIRHDEKQPVTLHRFASCFLPVYPGDHWLTRLEGFQLNESNIIEEPLLRGTKMVRNRDGVRNAQCSNPSFMVTLDGRPSESTGNVIAGTMIWSGNYKLLFTTDYANVLNISAGIDEQGSQYRLPRGETFITPTVALTFSQRGKGQATRNFHSWARKHVIPASDKPRDILLNSWEGVYFDVDQQVMNEMMGEFAALGGELFVMDDGWFGDKYPRNNGETSLGDWMVCKQKLPEGIEGLVRSADDKGIRFGIWIEPEMANTRSELYEKHPDWVLRHSNREPQTGRGGTQVVLDLTNPAVQDHVFSVVDNLLTANPRIAYIKWDANMALADYGSPYLPRDRQSHIFIEYHRGLQKVLERIRAKYPDVVMQACAAGGGRANYQLLKYFNECWTSDDTDALQRLYIQWGYGSFFPANTMACHVSASPNHQSGRIIPLKFRFDVAMTGRLGMEMHPKTLTDDEKAFARAAIETYKQIRPIVQQGDLYRMISPYDARRTASLMYVAPDKRDAVFFAWQMEYFLRQPTVRYFMDGLDPTAQYRLTEINKDPKSKREFASEGKTVSGDYLMTRGLSLPLSREFASIVIRLERIN